MAGHSDSSRETPGERAVEKEVVDGLLRIKKSRKLASAISRHGRTFR